jgi:hypothetical protein
VQASENELRMALKQLIDRANDVVQLTQEAPSSAREAYIRTSVQVLAVQVERAKTVLFGEAR